MLAEIRQDIADHHTFAGLSPHRLDDQRWFTRHYLRHPNTVALDVNGVIFHTLHDVSPERIVVHPTETGILYSTITKTNPCVIHGNGNGIDSFHDVSRRLVAKGWPPNATADATTGLL